MLGINEICNELNALAAQNRGIKDHFQGFYDAFRAFVTGQDQGSGLTAEISVGELAEGHFPVRFLDKAFGFELAVEPLPDQANLRGVVRCREVGRQPAAAPSSASTPAPEASFAFDAAGYLDEIDQKDGQRFYLPHPGVAARIGTTTLLDAVRK